MAKERQLTGQVQGEDASDIEEYFCTALDENKNVFGYEFQVSYVAGRNIPGEIRLDVLVFDGSYTPVNLDGEFAHKTQGQKDEDRTKDNLLDSILKNIGAFPTIRIPGEEIDSWEKAAKKVKELFG